MGIHCHNTERTRVIKLTNCMHGLRVRHVYFDSHATVILSLHVATVKKITQLQILKIRTQRDRIICWSDRHPIRPYVLPICKF